MPNQESPDARLVPAWRGITGWLLCLVSLLLTVAMPWPYSVIVLLLVAGGQTGVALIWMQESRSRR